MADDFFGDFSDWSAGVEALAPPLIDPFSGFGFDLSGVGADPSGVGFDLSGFVGADPFGGAGGGLAPTTLIFDSMTGETKPFSAFSAEDQGLISAELYGGTGQPGAAVTQQTPSGDVASLLRQQRDAALARNDVTAAANAEMMLQRLGYPSQGGFNWQTAAALGLGGLPALLGLAGLGQQLAGGGGNTSTTTVQHQVPGATGTEAAASQLALQGLQQAQQFAYGGPQGTATLLGARVPAEEAAFERGLQELAGVAGSRQGLETALTPAIRGTLPALLGTQALTLGQLPGVANAYLTNPAVSAAQQAQALGMTQGRLPALDPAIQARIGQVFDTRRGALLRDLLDAGRQRGFAGGLETFREPPGNVAGPYLADLAGQQAMAELQYASQLPLLGAQLEASRVGTGQQGLQGLINAASAFTTPSSVLGGLGMNLMNINQNIARALGDIGQAGVANRTDFLRAISAPLSVANQTAATLGQQRLGSAPTTQMTEQTPSLLSAFAPTAQLLAGTGGLLSGLGQARLI